MTKYIHTWNHADFLTTSDGITTITREGSSDF